MKDLISKTLSRAQQEMALTLPNQLLAAFNHAEHQKYTDPETGKPFASFYRWLWVLPPPGVGLCAKEHIGAAAIIDMLKRTREGMSADLKGPITVLIEDLVKGIGASAGKGGRPKKG